jgi:hypothetical protein
MIYLFADFDVIECARETILPSVVQASPSIQNIAAVANTATLSSSANIVANNSSIADANTTTSTTSLDDESGTVEENTDKSSLSDDGFMKQIVDYKIGQIRKTWGKLKDFFYIDL